MIAQTSDDRGIVQSIELLKRSLEKGGKEDLSLTWKIENINSPSRFMVRVIILDSLLQNTTMLTDSLELNLDL